MDIIDPHKGLNKKDIANGRVQLNLLDLIQAKQIHKDGLKNQKDSEDRAEEYAKAHPHHELPKKEEIAKQLRLGIQEKSGKKENIKEEVEAQPVAPVQTSEIYKNAQDAENKPELPTTFDHQDLARALKANYKNTKEDEK